MNWPYLAVGALAGVILIIFASYVTITGFTVNEELFSAQLGAAYTEQVGVVLADEQEHEFVPTISCYEEGCGITSLKVSGEIRSNHSGTVRVYVDDGKEKYLVLEESILLGSHEITESVMSEENTSFFNETTNETEVQTFYTTHENTYSVEEPGATSFKHVCDESCEFFLASRVMYHLSFEAPEGVEIEIRDLTYVWNVPGREIPEVEVLNETDVNMTEPQNDTNLTLSPPLVFAITGLAAVDFSARENASTLPANWFISSEPLVSENGVWEWEPYSEDNSGIFLPLQAMRLPQEEYRSVEVKLYSRMIEVEENKSIILNLAYESLANEGCLQLGMDTYREGIPLTTYFLTLSREASMWGEDFDVNNTMEDGQIIIEARLLNGIIGNKAQFSFTPLCDDGAIILKNFTYMFINNSRHQ